MQQQTPSQAKPRSLRRAFVLAGTLVFVDAFWINQGVLSGLVALGLLFVYVPRTLLEARFVTERVRNLAIYLSAVVLSSIGRTTGSRTIALRF